MSVRWKQTTPTRIQRRIVQNPIAASLIGGPGIATIVLLLMLAPMLQVSWGRLQLLGFWMFVSLMAPLLVWLLCRQVRRWDAFHLEPRG